MNTKKQRGGISENPKYKFKTTGKLVIQLQNLINAKVRNRDDLGGYFKCMACGEYKPMKSANAGHYFSRGNYPSVRFDLFNIWTCCIKCNYHLHGNLIPFRENLIKKIGENQFRQLEMKAHLKNFKYTREFLITEIERLKKELSK